MTQPALNNMPDGNNEPDGNILDYLAHDLEDKKRAESGAKAERIKAEELLLSLSHLQRHPQASGSKTTKGARYSVTVKDEQKARFVGDNDEGRAQLWEVLSAAGIAQDDMPIKVTYSIDVKKLDAIKNNNLDLYTKLVTEAGIERYAAKPSVSIKSIES